MQVTAVLRVLEAILAGSKVVADSDHDIGEYIFQVFTAPRKNSMKMATESDVHAQLDNEFGQDDVSAAIDVLVDSGVVERLQVQASRASVVHMFPMPEALPVMDELAGSPPQDLGDEELENLVAEVRQQCYASMREAIVRKRLAPYLAGSKLDSKTRAIGLFLLLMGAASRPTALRIIQTGTKEFRCQSVLVRCLNLILGKVFPRRRRKSRFQPGSIDDDLRRRQPLEDASAKRFRWEKNSDGSEAYYFELADGSQAVPEIVGILEGLLDVPEGDMQEACAHFGELVDDFAYDSPINETDRVQLFGERPAPEYYSLLRQAIRSLSGGDHDQEPDTCQ